MSDLTSADVRELMEEALVVKPGHDPHYKVVHRERIVSLCRLALAVLEPGDDDDADIENGLQLLNADRTVEANAAAWVEWRAFNCEWLLRRYEAQQAELARLRADQEAIAREAVREFAEGFAKVADESAAIAGATAKEAGRHDDAVIFRAAAATWKRAAECVRARAERCVELLNTNQQPQAQ